jgi:uncharacterized protein YidB (DUF937 family)
MGLLDQVLGGLMSGSGGAPSPMQGVLMNLLGGQQQQGAANSQGGAAGFGAAGLPALVSAFEQAGLGHVVQSWISGDQNHPVSPDQLQNVLGEDKVNAMASQSGMAPQDFLSQLSQHLPNAVNGMTPNGRLPDEGSVSV